MKKNKRKTFIFYIVFILEVFIYLHTFKTYSVKGKKTGSEESEKEGSAALQASKKAS